MTMTFQENLSLIADKAIEFHGDGESMRGYARTLKIASRIENEDDAKYIANVVLDLILSRWDRRYYRGESGLMTAIERACEKNP